MKVLVTGATGYVGHNLALALAQQGNEVNILVRNPGSPFIPRHRKIRVFKGDIMEKISILPSIKGCERVFHTAALVRLYANRTSSFYDINVEGTRHVLDVALDTGVKKFIFTSTCGVIGPSLKKPMTETDPRIAGFNNDYDLSKFLAERLVVDYSRLGLFAVIASVTKVYGPGVETHPLSVNSIIRRFFNGQITFCPSPDHLISNYVFIDDLVKGHIQAIEKGKSGEKYILGGENLSYAGFFQILRAVSGNKGILLPISKSVARVYGGWHFVQAKLQRKEPFFTAKGVNQVFCNKSFDCSKAIKELGYTITPFTSALQQSIHFFNNKLYE
ncbi:MAG: NAD-dependent epimerase/dehydratase family protein [Chitinophagaceae bacterium]